MEVRLLIGNICNRLRVEVPEFSFRLLVPGMSTKEFDRGIKVL